jgi:hypothetical protein|tara:strand:- start:271 stop:501 length:231 start_codon:yes stop_codon:yes gene_type:complete
LEEIVKMISEKFKSILEELQEAEKDALKCDKGNASAARRLRKVCLAAMKELKELRADIIQEVKANQKAKEEKENLW